MHAVIFIVSGVLFFAILYFLIKAAVRNGIIEARNVVSSENIVDDGTQISKVTCPGCGKKHDMDYPDCPYCGHPC